MRLYFFGNMYLSSIQQGIQAAHVTAALLTKYAPPAQGHHGSDTHWDRLMDWARNHQTMILLNGGYGRNLHALVERFSQAENPFPWCQFHESPDALEGALTSVGILLPERIYDASRTGDFYRDYFTKWEIDLALEMSKYRLAA